MLNQGEEFEPMVNSENVLSWEVLKAESCKDFYTFTSCHKIKGQGCLASAACLSWVILCGSAQVPHTPDHGTQISEIFFSVCK